MSSLRRIPALLSLLLLGAHFLRFGHLAGMALCLALVIPLFMPQAFARSLVRMALLLGTLLWTWVLIKDARIRISAGEPWMRLVCILGGVAVFTAVSSWLLRIQRPEAG